MARPNRRSFPLALELLLSVSVAPLFSQSAPPTAYTLTQAGAMTGPSLTETIYRSGSKALIDRTMPPSSDMPKGFHTRSLYDLQTNTSFIWDVNQSPMACSKANFSGSWGDPFSSDAPATPADLAQQNAKAAGSETINGFAANIFEIEQPAKMKLWVESKYGLVVKMQVTQPGSQPQIVGEVKQLSLATPAAATFALPPDCAAAAGAPKIPTEAERIAAETGGNAADVANATYGPGSDNSCTVLYRVVKAGSMEPIATGYQVAVDTTYNPDHPPSYSTGAGAHATFSGGGMKDITSQIRNGVLRIENAPKVFYLDTYFGAGGDSSAMIYRHCFAPETVLLYVVKNPANISEGGDWLYVKSGKYATIH